MVEEGSPRAARLRHLLAVLKGNGYASVHSLAAELGVSVATVRRDLAALARSGAIARTHGGALSLSDRSTAYEPTMDQKRGRQRAEKEAIGRLAASLVHPGETLLLDAGSTTWHLARQLRGLGPLTVVSNDLTILETLGEAQQITVLDPGGTVRPHVFTLLGTQTLRVLEGLRVNWTFLGADAIDLEMGITNVNIEEVAVKQAMLRAGLRVAVLADHTKFGVRVLAQVCPLTQVQLILTDPGVPSSMVDRIRDLGVDLKIAEVPAEKNRP
jgi:DeoR family transcriptional regulator of aga operon